MGYIINFHVFCFENLNILHLWQPLGLPQWRNPEKSDRQNVEHNDVSPPNTYAKNPPSTSQRNGHRKKAQP